MKLRHNPASPYVRKVMVVAHELGLADKIELLSTAVSPVESNAALAAENPLVKIPALTTDDGQVLFDSPVICEYLDSLAGGGKVFPASGKARWTALCQQALGDGILDALILCRYEIAARPEEKTLFRLYRGRDAQGASGPRRARARGSVGHAHDRRHHRRVHPRLSRFPLPGGWLAQPPSEARRLVQGSRAAAINAGDQAAGGLKRAVTAGSR